MGGMILQEVVTHDKLLPMLSVSGQENKVSMLALMGEAETEAASFDGQAYAKTLPGIRDNAEFFDPLRFCSQRGVTEGKIKFYREVELKHGRVGMLAAGYRCRRELPSALWRRHRRARVPRVPADAASGVLAGCGVGDRDSRDLLGAELRAGTRRKGVEHSVRPRLRQFGLRPA